MSTISPWFKTKILSALIIVDNLWAITKVVLFLVKFIIAFWTFSSDSESNDEVASSNKIIGEFLRTALAIEILWFCQPDNFTTFSADNLSAEGTKWSSATQTLVGSHNLSTGIPCFFNLSNSTSIPNPIFSETSGQT